MQFLYFACLLIVCVYQTNSQMYFPPNDNSEWESISPDDLDWCQPQIDSLYSILDKGNTKAFILLKDGKIVLEKYFGTHTANSNWYWASAGKSLTAFLIGIAQQENYLNIEDKSSKYLGSPWSECTPSQEEQITIWHQLTMTSGLDDRVSDQNCTDLNCLKYLTDAGSRWAYHNAPYTLLEQVIENATGQTINQYTNQKVTSLIGMNGAYINQGYNKVFFSTARSMARFALLILNKGNWNGNKILSDSSYFNSMVNTSQNLNLSYGYLWWLNGKSSFMIPQTQIVFIGNFNSNAPSDMFAALGKNGQFINVVPSQNMVLIRMGDNPDNSLVPFMFNDEIWQYINKLNCTPSGLNQILTDDNSVIAFPNPIGDYIDLNVGDSEFTSFELTNNYGQVVLFGDYQYQIDTSKLAKGIYFLKITNDKTTETIKLVKH